jgi:hypothetical protein
MYSNVDADGNYVVANPISGYDWFLQSLCSAHLEQRFQWGENLGVEGKGANSRFLYVTLFHAMTLSPESFISSSLICLRQTICS